MESAKTETMREIERLTRGEVNNLKRQVLGYGNFKRLAMKLEMPTTTLRDVLNKEYGEPATIEKIRRAFTSNQNVNTLSENS